MEVHQRSLPTAPNARQRTRVPGSFFVRSDRVMPMTETAIDAAIRPAAKLKRCIANRKRRREQKLGSDDEASARCLRPRHNHC